MSDAIAWLRSRPTTPAGMTGSSGRADMAAAALHRRIASDPV